MTGQQKKIAVHSLYILIDTNIYLNDPLLYGKQFSTLLAFASRTNSRIIVPDVVSKEVSKNYGERVDKDFTSIVSRYPDAIDSSKIIPNLKNELTERWQQLTDNTPESIAVDSVKLSLEELLDRSLQELPPFGKKSRGFRDALIWESAKEYLRSKQDKYPLVLITNNSADFGKGELDPILSKEIKELGREAYYYKDIAAFLQSHDQQPIFIDDDFVGELADNEYERLNEKYNNDNSIIDYTYGQSRHQYEDIEVLDSETLGIVPMSYFVSHANDHSFFLEVEVEVLLKADIMTYE